MNTRRVTSAVLIALMLVWSACGGDESADPGMEPAPVDTSEIAETGRGMGEDIAPQDKINLNTATAEDFQTIPSVGERMVGEFLEYQPYVSIQEFRREIGKYVDEAQVAAYEEYVFVPIDPNASDAETIMQVSGVDATEADALVASRPYETREAFLQELGTYVSADELTAAEAYLSADE